MKKKKNLISIIPAFLLMGAAVGIQTKNLTKHAVIGLIVGIIVYFFLKFRNNNSSKTKS
jgi:branched-subunit amino acid transport protein